MQHSNLNILYMRIWSANKLRTNFFPLSVNGRIFFFVFAVNLNIFLWKALSVVFILSEDWKYQRCLHCFFLFLVSLRNNAPTSWWPWQRVRSVLNMLTVGVKAELKLTYFKFFHVPNVLILKCFCFHHPYFVFISFTCLQGFIRLS